MRVELSEVKALDLLKRDYCESICQGCVHCSRTELRGSKTIRYRPSLFLLLFFRGKPNNDTPESDDERKIQNQSFAPAYRGPKGQLQHTTKRHPAPHLGDKLRYRPSLCGGLHRRRPERGGSCRSPWRRGGRWPASDPIYTYIYIYTHTHT